MKVSDAVQLEQANIIHPLGIQEPAIIQNTSKDSAASWYTGPNRNVTTILLQFSKPPHCVCSINHTRTGFQALKSGQSKLSKHCQHPQGDRAGSRLCIPSCTCCFPSVVFWCCQTEALVLAPSSVPMQRGPRVLAIEEYFMRF